MGGWNVKAFIRKFRKLFELTPEQLKYAEEQLKTIFGLNETTMKKSKK